MRRWSHKSLVLQCESLYQERQIFYIETEPSWDLICSVYKQQNHFQLLFVCTTSCGQQSVLSRMPYEQCLPHITSSYLVGILLSYIPWSGLRQLANFQKTMLCGLPLIKTTNLSLTQINYTFIIWNNLDITDPDHLYVTIPFYGLLL